MQQHVEAGCIFPLNVNMLILHLLYKQYTRAQERTGMPGE